ncbi:hypothetical protein Ccrd_019551 [Cynara cardunculus var. scolymus]|uniref:Pentatricopeptide repeat-containing protein n=1 Tax=Cynara cardunculus var. scolymus TaxID=59895 RepID=A0A124SF56_CYNCS|nr:hypothetical protein Ccrd_019551 [Cynara cardunculus var. scolymus]
MLIAYGLHGWGDKALEIYKEMVASGLKPDNITFTSLLMTCSHLGLINRGRALFKSMSQIYGISPETEHVACMVDMLARGGYLEEAREMTNMYTRTHGATAKSSEALFGACYSHRDVDMGAKLGGVLKVLDPQHEMSYVVLSNLYCASEKWKEAELVRKAMADHGVKKMPGCSWIEVKNKVMAFVAGPSLQIFFNFVFELLPPITRASHFFLFKAALHLSISIGQEAPSSSDASFHVDIFLFARESEVSYFADAAVALMVVYNDNSVTTSKHTTIVGGGTEDDVNPTGVAENHIRRAETYVMVVGGTEVVNPIGVGGFIICRALSKGNHEPH